MRAPTLWSTFLLSALIAVACGTGATSETARSATTAPAGQSSAFRLNVYQGEDVLGGKEVDFRDLLTHGKPVVLNFWAGLCVPCRTEMPSFERVYARYKDQLVLVGVDVGPFLGLGSHEDGRRLLQLLGVTYPAAYAEDSAIVREYQLVAMPTTVFFGADGKQLHKYTGLLTEAQLEEQFRELTRGGR